MSIGEAAIVTGLVSQSPTICGAITACMATPVGTVLVAIGVVAGIVGLAVWGTIYVIERTEAKVHKRYDEGLSKIRLPPNIKEKFPGLDEEKYIYLTEAQIREFFELKEEVKREKLRITQLEESLKHKRIPEDLVSNYMRQIQRYEERIKEDERREQEIEKLEEEEKKNHPHGETEN